MKKILIGLGAAVAVLVMAAVVAVALTFMGRTAIVDGFQSGPVRVVKDGMVSVAFLDIGQGSVALVDAGNDNSGQAIKAELSRRGLSVDAVKAILLTHGHGDHIAAVPLFPKAEVLALEDEIPLAEGRVKGKGPLFWIMPSRPTGIKVTRGLKDGESLQLGELSVRVFAVPGHTAGSAAYLTEGVLIMGDSADMRSNGRVTGSPWLFSDDRAEDHASLLALGERLSEEGAEVKALVFSHSGAVSQGLAPLQAYAEASR